MNNWHIKIEDCTEAQKERLKQVYGTGILRYDYYGRDKNSIAAYNFDVGELITPDEAFERLGLTAKPLSKINWSLIDPDITLFTQSKRTGEIYFQKEGSFSSDDWQIIATRPKPKYTRDELEIAEKVWMAFFEDDESNQTLFHDWIKEVRDEA